MFSKKFQILSLNPEDYIKLTVLLGVMPNTTIRYLNLSPLTLLDFSYFDERISSG